MSHALIGCPADALDLRAVGKGKGGMHSAPVMPMDWHRCTPPKLTVTQRHNQLPFNQKIKFL
jgi:hypothetical protein